MKKHLLLLIMPATLAACKESGESSATKVTPAEETRIEVSYTPIPDPETVAEAKSTLAILKARYDWSNVPKNLAVPTDREAATEFARAVRTLRATSGPDLALLKAIDIADLEGITPVAERDLKRSIGPLIERLETSLPKDLAKSIKLTNAAFDQWLRSQEKWVRQGADADPADRDDIVNLLTPEDIVTRREQAGATALENMLYAAVIDGANGSQSEWPARHAAFEPVLEKCRANVAAASAGVEVPTGIDRPELEKIARQVLAEKRYDLPEPEQVIVKTGKRKQTRIEFTVVDDSVVKITRAWDEFQVATVEKDKTGGRILFYYNLRYYHRGASTTPVGKWVLGQRFRSAKVAD